MSMDISNFVLEDKIFSIQNCTSVLRVVNQNESNDDNIQKHRARSIRTHDPGDGR